MLNLLDDSLEAFLRATVPLPESDVAVAFEAPDREWGSQVNGPTINLYLWDVRENASEREMGQVARTDGNGTRRYGPRPMLDCRYLLTVWTAQASDEHALLGRVLTTVLRHDHIAAEFCRGPLSTVQPYPRLALKDGGVDNSDFWSALGGQLKPGLDLVVTVTADVALSSEAGPPVETVQVDEQLMGRGAEPH